MGSDSVKTAFDAEMRVIMACDDAVMGAVTGYAESEIFFFPLKRELARKWKELPSDMKDAALDDAEFALLVHEAGSMSAAADVDGLVDMILKKDRTFEAHAGMCFRVKRHLVERIRTAAGDRKAIREIIDHMVFPSYK